MIERKVSVVVQLRDGFLGKPLERVQPQCRIDGVPCQPQIKPGGYLVWVDLPVGSHRLTLFVPGFQTEEIMIECLPHGIWQGSADLKPGAGYPIGKSAVGTRLHILSDGQPLAAQEVWFSVVDRPLFKLAQTRTEAGAQRVRLFRVQKHGAVPVPGVFLLEDNAPELLFLQAVAQEEGVLARPLLRAHTRGKALSPAQRDRTDALGMLPVLLREAAKLAVFYDGMIQYAQIDGGQEQIDLYFGA